MRVSPLIAACLLLASCGGSSGPTLTADEQLGVAKAREAFSYTVLNSSQYQQTLEGVDYLIRLCRAKPEARYEIDDLTMRQVVEDGANTLEEYRPALASQLDRVARSGCE